MTHVVKNRVRETTTTTGTGEYTLAGAVTGYQSFASAVGASNTCPYRVTDGINWECGIGTIVASPNRLQRTIVLSSSNSGSAVNWSAGSKDVVLDALAELAGPQTSYGSRGLSCLNNSGTPNTQFDLDADEIVLRDANGWGTIRIAPGAAITCNISNSPASNHNCRDQVAAFSNSTWIHFYWVYNIPAASLLVCASVNAPPTGPTLANLLLAGTTHWAYAGAVYLNGSGNLERTRILGNTAWREAPGSALSAGSATTETAVSLTALIPPGATSALLMGAANLTTNASGGADETAKLRIVTGSEYAGLRVNPFGALENLWNSSMIEIPNVSQQLYYLWANNSGSGNVASRALDLTVLGYRLPNGGV